MSGKVTLRISRGATTMVALDFEEHDTVVFGRARDCHGRLPNDDTAVSRHHFLLEVNPPQARLRDLGSRHGTYVNGVKCGGRRPGEKAEDAVGRAYPHVDLKDGDEIRIGRTTIGVRIEGTVAPRPRTRDTDDAASEMLPGYEVTRRLGIGGMGAVYLARRQRDGVWVALKLMLAKVAVDESARIRFARESAIVEQLLHPNIVAFYERGSEGSSFYFTMEFCPGGSLSDLLKRRGGRLPYTEAVSIALQALDGLAYAHEREVEVELPDGRRVPTRGVVHRDIKPMNILLTGAENRWTAKISDFGLAKCFQTAGLSGCTVTGDAAGALPYMPREQLMDFKNVLPVSDVWSMAATIYETLTGATPRDVPQGRDPLEVILGGRIVPVLERDPTVPRAVAEVIDRALAEDPKQRFANAREFREALVAALSAGNDAPTQVVASEKTLVTQMGAEAAFVVIELASRETALSGETWSGGRAHLLRAALEAHPAASKILHLRPTGDGVLAVFADVPSAVEVAKSLQLSFGGDDVPLRRLVHWGALRVGPAGEPLGDEVRRAMVLRHVTEGDRESLTNRTIRPLARVEHVVVTKPVAERMTAEQRREFTLVGTFRLPGYDDALELWTR